MDGKTISHYDIREKLGAGGMGEIYKAHDHKLNRAVAIKVLPAGSAEAPERRRRFIQEAQAASALNHPNIITIYDIVSEQNTEYMVMEFIDGRTLDEVVPAQGLELFRIVDYAVQITSALEAAHTAGIVHRDLKPGNIMVTNSGLVKVLDFGLAKIDSDSASLTKTTTLTVEGSILGTVNYMSPEQAQGKRVDARSDIFSFGLVLYEMVTGQRAFDGDSQLSVMASILRDDVTAVSQKVRGSPPALDAIIARALAKNPDDRWQSIGEMRSALHELKNASNPTSLRLPQAPAKPPAGSATKIAIASAAVLAVGLAGAIWWKTRPAPPAAAEQQAAAPAPIPAAPPPAPAAAAPQEAVLTNDAVVEMWKAKVPPSLIVSQMKAGKTRFDLSPAGIIRLSQAGLPEYLVEAMRDPSKARIPGPAPAQPSTAAAVPPKAAESNPPPAPAAPAQPARTLTAVDGTPVKIILMEDVPVTVEAGVPIRFQTDGVLKIGDTVVIADRATVTGEIVDGAKKKLIGGSKATFRLVAVDAVDGGKVKVRTSTARGGALRLEHPNYSAAKGMAASAGTPYLAYVDGDQKITVR